ncbi:myb/sant-like dna-binding domain [Holotrichia oblita]|uniref:Myb/sant-like dna-binding domain n=1 Tax=Holotrichia oblita TaxID=644536 RepID=A0ACB9TRX1_HOLOL|nr:myb/sant-like dna-binding domain [Holotrichia oblita]
MSRKSRMTKSQKEIIVNFLEHNDSMIKNIKHTPAELNVLNKKWEELVTLLNSTDDAKKNAKEWKEAINEFKTNVRRKARAITYDHQGTGGGPAKAKPLNNLEERMLSLLSKIVILGAPDIPEAGIATAGPSSAPINVVVDAPLNVVADTTLEDYIILNQEPELQTNVENRENVTKVQHPPKRRKGKPLGLDDLTKVHENCMEILAESNNNIAGSLSQLAKAMQKQKRRQSSVLSFTF